jgi:hypothetical protein
VETIMQNEILHALLSRIAERVGIEPALAEKGVALILAFLRKEGPAAEIDTLFASIPGAAQLAAREGGESGVIGNLIGSMGGGIMVLGQQLMSEGLGMGQIKALSQELFAVAREQAGEDTMGAIVGAVPGLSQFI